MPFITTDLPVLPDEFDYTGEYRSVKEGEFGLGVKDGEWMIMKSEQDADLPLFIIRKKGTKPCLTLIEGG